MKFGLKTIFKDSIWTISGLMLMNIVAQFIVYPAWNWQFGSEEYGNILYMLSLMNIFAISIGSACNYARVTESRKGGGSASIYIIILVCATVLVGAVMLLIPLIVDVTLGVSARFFYVVLTVVTMWRFYADVEYRLSLNYKGYFKYYLVISIGYGIGIGLSQLTKLWPLALLPGELMGLIYVFWKGHSIRWEGIPRHCGFQSAMRAVVMLVVSNILSNIIFNGDRILLKSLLDGQAVTIYYLASLIGKTISLVTTPLSSIIISYLVRLDLQFNKKMMNIVTIGSITLTFLTTIACIIGSWVIIPVLYPSEYYLVRNYFLLGSLTQAVYFIAGMVMVVLLRFCDSRYQVMINVAYAVGFIVLCIPVTMFWGFKGFCIGMLVSSLIRFISALGVGYRNTKEKD